MVDYTLIWSIPLVESEGIWLTFLCDSRTVCSYVVTTKPSVAKASATLPTMASATSYQNLQCSRKLQRIFKCRQFITFICAFHSTPSKNNTSTITTENVTKKGNTVGGALSFRPLTVQKFSQNFQRSWTLRRQPFYVKTSKIFKL